MVICPCRTPGRAEVDRRGIVASRLAGTGRLNADDAYGCVIHEGMEHADGIGAAAHGRNDRIGKTPGFLQHLGTGFAPDDALKIPDQRGEGVRTRRRTETVVRGFLRGDPVTQRLVDGVLERPGTALDGPDFSAEQLHAPHVGGLALHVLGTHENDAFKPQTGGRQRLSPRRAGPRRFPRPAPFCPYAWRAAPARACC